MHHTTLPASLNAPQPALATRLAAALAMVLLTCLATGCTVTRCSSVDQATLLTPERFDRGYVVILPGIGGNVSAEYELLVGLARSDLPVAIEMIDWTAGPNKLFTNLHGIERNREQAGKIAERIVNYQRHYPGRPVSVVGYSGGAGIAVMTLEALPPQHRVDRTILLGATLAPDYDLRQAMAHSAGGIHNFYSQVDVPILMGAIAVVGTMEGRHTVAAGAWGFVPPKHLDERQREQYKSQLIQESYNLDMLAAGHMGDHYGWLASDFIDQWLVPLVVTSPVYDLPAASFASDAPAPIR